MRSAHFYDEELIRIWKSWGVEFPPNVSISCMTDVIRELENCIGLSFQEKYIFIQSFSKLSETDFNKLGWQINHSKDKKPRKNGELFNRLEWALLCLVIQGELKKSLSTEVESNILSEVESRLISVWLKEGLPTVFFQAIEKEIQIRRSEETLHLSQYCSELMSQCFQLKLFDIASILAVISLRSLPCEDKFDDIRAPLLLELGNYLFLSSKFRKAQMKYRRAWQYYDGSLEGVVELNQDRAELLLFWGVALLNIGKLNEALTKFKQSWFFFENKLASQIEIDTSRAYLLFNWGLTLSRLDKQIEAQNMYQRSWNDFYNSKLLNLHELDDKRALLHDGWGVTLMQLGRLNEAEVKFKKAWSYYTSYSLINRTELNYARSSLLRNWAIVLTNLNMLEEAEKKFKLAWEGFYNGSLVDCSEYDADRARLLSNWGRVLIDLGRPDEAQTLFQQAWDDYFTGSLFSQSEFDLDRGYLFSIWAFSMYRLRKLDEALNLYQQAWSKYYSNPLKNNIKIDAGLGLLLIGWGNVLLELGRSQEAQTKFQKAWDDYYFGSLVDLLEFDIERARLLKSMGLALVQLGQPNEALDLYLQAWDDYYLCSLVDKKEFDSDRADLLCFIGSVLRVLGKHNEAQIKYQQAWDSYYNGSLLGRLEYDERRALMLGNWGLILMELGEIDNAQSKLEMAWDSYFLGSLVDIKGLDSDRAILLSNWALYLYQLGQLHEAKVLTQKVWDDYYNGSLIDRSELDPNRALLLMNMGLIYRDLNNLTKERFFYSKAWGFYTGSLNVRFDLNCDRAKLLHNWGISFSKTGESQNAFLKYKQAFQLYSVALQGQQHLNPNRCGLFFDWLQTMSDHIDQTWAYERSKEMGEMLGISDWRDNSNGEELVSEFYIRFHAHWLQRSLVNNEYTFIPSILSAMQGRKLSRLILDGIDQSDIEFDTPEEVKTLILYRKKIRQLSAQMKIISSNGSETSNEIYRMQNVLALSEETIVHKRRVLEKLSEEYQHIQSLYNSVYSEVSQLEDYQHLVIPYQQINTDQLQSELRERQALLTLFDLQISDKHKMGNDFKIKTFRLIFAWILLPQGNPLVVTLDSQFLSDLSEQIQAKYIVDSKGLGLRMRGAPSTVQKSNIAFKGWDYFEEQLSQYLWKPINRITPEIKELFLVTHGRFHRLPLTIGCPWKEMLIHYPGLLFFKQSRQNKLPQTTAHAAISYTGQDLKLAPKEGELLNESVWSKFGHEDPELKQQLPEEKSGETLSLASLYFACHGDTDEENPDLTHLNLGNQNKVTFHEILRMKYRPATSVFIGACVAGQTFEDRDGDPLGPVTAFMLRGTQVVIACLTKVPDEYMPLLSMLTEYTAINENLSLNKALEKAKQHLSDWQSQPKYVHLVAGYREWMKKTFKDWLKARYQDDHQFLDTGTNGSFKMSVINLIDDEDVNTAAFDLVTPSIHPKFEQAMEHGLATSLDYIADHMAEKYMTPPLSVIDLLTHSVRAFGSGN